MTTSASQFRAYHRTHSRLSAEVAAMIDPPASEVSGDVTTAQFCRLATDILALEPDEFRRRLPEFGFAVMAIVQRIARIET